MRRRHGFTIIELLVALAIVGILVAIAVWKYHASIQRARQKRTMADMRSIATAWEGRATDVKSYNAAAAGFTMPAGSLSERTS